MSKASAILLTIFVVGVILFALHRWLSRVDDRIDLGGSDDAMREDG